MSEIFTLEDEIALCDARHENIRRLFGEPPRDCSDSPIVIEDQKERVWETMVIALFFLIIFVTGCAPPQINQRVIIKKITTEETK